MYHPPLAKIAKRLAVTADRSQVIEELCTQYGLYWQDAEALVAQAEAEYQSLITRQQAPVLVLVALFTFMIGVLLVAWNLLGVISGFASLISPNLIGALNLLGLYSEIIATLLNFSYSGSLFIVGLGMMFGSQWGMRDIWASWLETWQIEADELHPSPATHQVEVKEKNIDFIERQLMRGVDESTLVGSLQARTGMGADEALELVHIVMRAKGEFAVGPISPAAFLAALASFIFGAVLFIQNIFLLNVYLRANPRPVQNSLGILLRIIDIRNYIEAHPGLGLWFVLGVVALVVGYFSLRMTLPSALLRINKRYQSQ